MSAEVTAAVIAAGASVPTLIGAVVAQIIAPGHRLRPGGERVQVKELFVVGTARLADRQVLPCAVKPVANRQQVFVGGAAGRAVGEVSSHRGALLPVQRAQDVGTEIAAPSGTVLVHLLAAPFPSSPFRVGPSAHGIKGACQ
ncbi:MAG TPA: hypothetical protein VMA73_17535 [Streptosporangiaceae bacterium]|nr:hypothetical protein [Streptosporangiaceae bacterium]